MLNNLLNFFKKRNSKNSNLIGKKIADQVTKVSRNSPQNSLVTVASKTQHIGFDKKEG